MSPVVVQADNEGAVRDLIFRHYYILYRDLGADRLGVKAVYKTGDKLDKYLSQGKAYDQGVTDIILSYPDIIISERYILSLINAVKYNYYRVNLSRDISKGLVLREKTRIFTISTIDRLTRSITIVTSTRYNEDENSLSIIEKMQRLLSSRKQGAVEETNIIKTKTVANLIINKLNELLKINKDILALIKLLELIPNELIIFLTNRITKQNNVYNKLIKEVKQTVK